MRPTCLCIILSLKGCSDSSIQVTCRKLKYLLPMKLLVAVSWLFVSGNFFFFPRKVRAVLFSSVLRGWYFCLPWGVFLCFALWFFWGGACLFKFSKHYYKKTASHCIAEDTCILNRGCCFVLHVLHVNVLYSSQYCDIAPLLPRTLPALPNDMSVHGQMSQAVSGTQLEKCHLCRNSFLYSG